jgi:hypothetical protein
MRMNLFRITRSAFAFALITLGLQIAPGAADDANPLVGVWKLQTFFDKQGGSAPVYAFGVKPIGLFVFSADGYASFSIMHNPPDFRVKSGKADPEDSVPLGYLSYFGTYTIDKSRGTWTTHVLGGNVPGWIGTNQTRPFKIVGNTLIISIDSTEDGKSVHAERTAVRTTATK